LEASKQKALELYNESLGHLEKLQGKDTETLKNIAALIIMRTH